MGASAAAAVIIAKEKHIVAAFREAGATSLGKAVAPATLGVHERLAFSKLRQHAVLREAGPGLFYLDEPSWEALRRFRRRLAIVVAVFAVIAVAALLARRFGVGAV